MVEHSASMLPHPAEVIANDGRPVAAAVRFVQRRVRVPQHLEVALVRFRQVRVVIQLVRSAGARAESRESVDVGRSPEKPANT